MSLANKHPEGQGRPIDTQHIDVQSRNRYLAASVEGHESPRHLGMAKDEQQVGARQALALIQARGLEIIAPVPGGW